jgi:hypothetical protein
MIQYRTLAALRGTLLQKLLSGEVGLASSL